VIQSISPRSLAGRAAGLLLVAAVLELIACDIAWAADPAKDFQQNCYSCHTIGGGRRTGPDLKGVLERKDRSWLVRFIKDPAAMLDSGDPYAQKLLQEAKGQRMTNFANMTSDRAEALLELIAVESKKPKDELRFPGVTISERPFTKADVEAGRRIFQGLDGLAASGPACIGCHTVGGLGGLGGGRLGPDLTKVFDRHESRLKLGTWLTAPPTLTMQPTFRDHPLKPDEVLSLIAYFKDASTNESEDTAPRGLVFTLLGLGGAVGVVLLFNRLWRRRFRAVRKPLVRASRLTTGGPETI
jgi:mono/diheme cytochrome c family protein